MSLGGGAQTEGSTQPASTELRQHLSVILEEIRGLEHVAMHIAGTYPVPETAEKAQGSRGLIGDVNAILSDIRFRLQSVHEHLLNSFPPDQPPPPPTPSASFR